MASIRDLFVRIGSTSDLSGVNKMNQGLAKMKKGAIDVGIAIVGVGFQYKKLFEAGAQQEMTQMTFETMLGSAEKAKDLLQDVRDLSLETPFKFEEAESTVKMMLAMGSAEKDVIEETRMLGDVSAGLNVPMARIALNFGQVRTMGKLAGRELRDFSVAGVPLLETLAKTMNKPKTAIKEMMSQGQVSFEMVKEAFRKMTSEGGRFNNLMEKSSKTAGGLASNIGVLVDLGLRDLGRKFNDSVMKGILKSFYDWGKQGKNVENMLKVLIAGTTMLGVALAGLGISKIIAGLTLMGKAGVIAQLKMLAIPILVGSAFMALGAIIEDIWVTLTDPEAKTAIKELLKILESDYPSAFETMTKGWEGFEKAMYSAFATLDQYIALSRALFSALSGNFKEAGQHLDEFRRLANFQVQNIGANDSVSEFASDVGKKLLEINPAYIVGQKLMSTNPMISDLQGMGSASKMQPVQQSGDYYVGDTTVNIRVDGAGNPDEVGRKVLNEFNNAKLKLQLKGM